MSLGLLDGGMIKLMCSVRDVLKTVSTLIQDGFGFSQRVGSSSVEPLLENENRTKRLTDRLLAEN